MSEEMKQKLFEVIESGPLEDVKTAFDACSTDERKEYGHEVLWYAAENSGSGAFDIAKFLMDRGGQGSPYALFNAVENPGPCAFDIAKLLMEHLNGYGECVKAHPSILHHVVKNTGPCALDIVKFMIENGADHHREDNTGHTVFTISIRCGNPIVADYLLSRDDFLLSDLMPCPKQFPVDIYRAYREKAISRAIELVDAKGLEHARAVVADIEKILKAKRSGPTKKDIEALNPITKKISSLDWMNDTRVTSGDFTFFAMSI